MVSSEAPGSKTSLATVLPLTIAGMLTLAVAMGIGRFIYTPILPGMIEDQVLNRAEAGSAAAFNYIGYLFGALLCGLSMLGANRRTWLLTALVLNAATTYSMALTDNILHFYALRFASGVSSAFAMIFVSSMVFDAIARSGKNWLLSLHFSGVGIGIAVSALFVPTVAEWSVQWALGGGASIVGLTLVIGLVMYNGDIQKSNPDVSSQMDSRLPNAKARHIDQSALSKTIHYLIIAYGLFGFGYVITATFISELARSVPSLSTLQESIWLYVGISAAFSTLICNLIASRLGLLLTFTGACFVEAIGVTLSVMSDEPSALIISAMFLGGTFVGATAIGLMAASRLAAASRNKQDHVDLGRKIIALMTVSFGLGQVFGPWIAGLLFQYYGNLIAASFCAVVALILSGLLSVTAWANHRI